MVEKFLVCCAGTVSVFLCEGTSGICESAPTIWPSAILISPKASCTFCLAVAFLKPSTLSFSAPFRHVVRSCDQASTFCLLSEFTALCVFSRASNVRLHSFAALIAFAAIVASSVPMSPASVTISSSRSPALSPAAMSKTALASLWSGVSGKPGALGVDACVFFLTPQPVKAMSVIASKSVSATIR